MSLPRDRIQIVLQPGGVSLVAYDGVAYRVFTSDALRWLAYAQDRNTSAILAGVLASLSGALNFDLKRDPDHVHEAAQAVLHLLLEAR